MTHTTPRLERAIEAGLKATAEAPNSVTEYEENRIFAQALIADLLLPDPPGPVNPDAEVITIGASFDYGFAAHEHMLKVRAGLVEE